MYNGDTIKNTFNGVTRTFKETGEDEVYVYISIEGYKEEEFDKYKKSCYDSLEDFVDTCYGSDV